MHKVLQFLFVDGISIKLPKFLTKDKVLYLGFPKTAIYMTPAFLCLGFNEEFKNPILFETIGWSLLVIGFFSFFYHKIFPKKFKEYSDKKILKIIEELKEKKIISEMPPGSENWNTKEFRVWLESLGLKL